MFCPRCGSANTDTVKFCRQCGLPMQSLAGYVATGGTAGLIPPPVPSSPIARLDHGLTPKQKMALAIVFSAMSPAIFGVLGADQLAGISAVSCPLLILLSVFYFRNQIRAAKAAALPPPALPLTQSPGQLSEAPAASAQPTTPTNPLKVPPGSVTEEETRRFDS